METSAQTLDALVSLHFADLTFAEKQLVSAIQTGEDAVCYETGDEMDFENPSTLSEKNVIRAKLLRFVLTSGADFHASSILHIKGAVVKESLDLSWKEVRLNVLFIYCYFDSPVEFSFATINGLGFSACVLPGMRGPVSKILGNLVLSETNCPSGVILDRSVIEGNLTISQSMLSAPEAEPKENTDNAENLPDAPTDTSTETFALSLISGHVKEAVILSPEFRSTGKVNFSGLIIDGDLDMRGAIVGNPNDYALGFTDLKVASILWTDGFIAFGKCMLRDVAVGRHIEIKDALFLPSSKDNISLTLEGASISKNVMIINTVFGGGVSMLATFIQGDLLFKTCRFSDNWSEVDALMENNLEKMFGSSHPSKFKARFTAEFMVVGRRFRWLKIEIPRGFVLDLLSAKVSTFVNDGTGWPAQGNLFIDGFTFANVIAEPFNAQQWIQWLNLQNGFYPGTYEQFVQFCRNTGRPIDLIEFAVAKKDRYFSSSNTGFLQKVGGKILKWTIGYGYKSHYALLWVLTIVVMGAFIFAYAHRSQALIESRVMPGGLNFSPIVYSLDTFIPILDFGQAGYWLPNNHIPWIQVYHWMHILLGWTLTTIAVLGFSGVVRRN